MEVSGVLPPDAPDPFAEAERRLNALPFPIWGLVPQRTLEDDRTPGIGTTTDGRGRAQIDVVLNYTVWRNPDDHADPVNLADLDERTRAAIEDVPPWPRPDWLVAQVESLWRPHLWEAVRTTWRRDPSPTDLAQQLVHHADHILINRFRTELSLPDGPPVTDGWRVSRSAVNDRVSAVVDGVRMPASEVDTDPLVYAIGAQVEPDLVVTAVIPREHLPLVDVAFARRG